MGPRVVTGYGVVITVTFLLFACATQQAALDPAQIEHEIAATKAEELDLVRATIREPARADRFIALLAEREQLLKRFSLQIAAHKEQMAKLNADYWSERIDFDAALADYNRRRMKAQREFVDLLADMKQTATADEWSKISAFQLKQLSPRELAYSGQHGGGE